MSAPTKMSSLYAPTLKENPAEAELASHQILLRAGMIRRVAAGVYTYLPLAWRSIKKLENIIREELDAIGAQEILMPVIQPAELWHNSGRWNDYGPELMRLKDRHEREFALGPTHEEVITTLVQNELKSYKQLPVHLYQIQTKFRDEIRPRFGLLRGREFIMKDAYSFDKDDEGLDKTYHAYGEAYGKICSRMGLEYRAVDADAGQIGGHETVEFMALAESGEGEIIYCECGYAADTEAALAEITVLDGPDGELEKVRTPHVGTMDELAQFFKVEKKATIKSMALIASDKSPVLALLPGDHDLNEVKAEREFGADYKLMDADDLEKYGLVKGFIGPINLNENIRLVADVSLKDSSNWIIGANEVDYHYKGAVAGKDFREPEYLDLALAQAGDICPKCGKKLETARGIEVGQIFKLGTKYSEALNSKFVDENGDEKPFIMGCYGIGVSRSLAAIIEQHHDEYGIIWPVNVAPYEISIIPLQLDDELIWPLALKLAQNLTDAGIEVVLDDRDERAGVKFADNDLMGFPYQLVLGKRNVEQGKVELKERKTGDKQLLDIDEAVRISSDRIKRERK